MIDEVLFETEEGMENAVTALEKDLAGMRTGRASTALVDRMLVEYYGTPTELKELALVSVPEPQLIAIKPFDPGSVKDIERAIMSSDLGLNPNNDGKIIRLQLPSLTEERRRELTKVASRRVEDARVSVRNVRRDSLSNLKNLEKDKEISEDEHHGAKDEVQKLTDEYIKKIDEIGKEKAEEIMTV